MSFRPAFLFFCTILYSTRPGTGFDLVSTLLSQAPPELRGLIPPNVIERLKGSDPGTIEKLLQKLKPVEGRFDPALLDLLTSGHYPMRVNSEAPPNIIPLRPQTQPPPPPSMNLRPSPVNPMGDDEPLDKPIVISRGLSPNSNKTKKFSSRFRQGAGIRRISDPVQKVMGHVTDPNIRNHRLFDKVITGWDGPSENYANFTMIDTMEDLMADEGVVHEVTEHSNGHAQSPWFPVRPTRSTPAPSIIRRTGYPGGGGGGGHRYSSSEEEEGEDSEESASEPSRVREPLKKGSTENRIVVYPYNYSKEESSKEEEVSPRHPDRGDETEETLFKPSQVDLSMSPPEFFTPDQDFYTSTISATSGHTGGPPESDLSKRGGLGGGVYEENTSVGQPKRKHTRKRTRVRSRKRLKNQESSNFMSSFVKPTTSSSRIVTKFSSPTNPIVINNSPVQVKPNRHVKVIYHPPKYKKRYRKEYYYDSPGTDGIGSTTSATSASYSPATGGLKLTTRPDNSIHLSNHVNGDSAYDQTPSSSSHRPPPLPSDYSYDHHDTYGSNPQVETPTKSREPDETVHYLRPTGVTTFTHNHHGGGGGHPHHNHHNHNNNNNQHQTTQGSGHPHHNHHGGGHSHHNHHQNHHGGGHHHHHHGHGHGHHHNHHAGGHPLHNLHNHHQTAASQHHVHAYDPHYVEEVDPFDSLYSQGVNYITEVTADTEDDSWLGTPAIILGGLTALTIVCAFLIPSFLTSFTGKESTDKNDIIPDSSDIWTELKGFYNDILSIIRGQGYRMNNNLSLPDRLRQQLQDGQMVLHHLNEGSGYRATTMRSSSDGEKMRGEDATEGGEEEVDDEATTPISEEYERMVKNSSVLAFGVTPFTVGGDGHQIDGNLTQSGRQRNITHMTRTPFGNWTQIPLLSH